MEVRVVLFIFLCLLYGLCCVDGGTRPNILLIVVDDVGEKWVLYMCTWELFIIHNTSKYYYQV